jgi:hypothetical protein
MCCGMKQASVLHQSTEKSVLARQLSQAADPLLRSLRGGGGPPSVYWQSLGGDLHI